MDTELNSPARDGGDGDSSAAFRKLSNDGTGRKYRRRALADDGSSSSQGSQERNQSPNPKHSRGDARKVSEPVHERKDGSRYGRGGIDSHRRDRYFRDDKHGSKHGEYNRHERDAARSSSDSRGGRHSDRRRVESEHGRSIYDSGRHSRDKYSNEKGEGFSSHSRRHTGSRMEDKEKGFVRGRGNQDEKRGPHSSFGGRHSRDERKEHEEDLEEKKEEVHVKSPRDRTDGKGLAAEDRDTPSKKLKGFTSEKFTHGKSFFYSCISSTFILCFIAPCSLSYSYAEEEKHSSSFKPPLGAGTLQSRSKEVEVPGDVDAAKVAAMQAAELVNKNLVGTGYLTTDQKKKLLWGKKKSTAIEEPAHRWDSALIGDRERQEKFNKLMGVKGSAASQEQNQHEIQAEKQKELQMDLEKQYTAGLRRRDGRTVGLGL
ncbi:unnamed protein product [Cochlearia groenlandica]